MTSFLIASRIGIVIWVTLALLPLEIAFDAIDGELERRGVVP